LRSVNRKSAFLFFPQPAFCHPSFVIPQDDSEDFAKVLAGGYARGLMLLPIVIRELRVSARKKATHRLRLLFAAGAAAIGGGLGLLSMLSRGFGGGQLGVWIFEALKWIAFVFSCAAGIFLTSDCLSEEKREGTLGLIFLTDLRGHDVVLGKLLATSLRTFYSLLAIFPVMALSFVLGGVGAADFWQTLLSLCNTLFFSLALGMLISAVSRDPHKAMTGSLAAMAACLFLIPKLDVLLLGRYAGAPRIGLLSPAYAFTHAGYYPASDFWMSLVLVNLAGWSCLGIASWLAPRTWQEKAVRPGPGTGRRLRLIGPAAGARGGRLLDQNPICWIISRDRWAARLARLAIVLVFGIFSLSLASVFLSQGRATPAPATAARAAIGMTVTTSTNGNAVTTVTTLPNGNAVMYSVNMGSRMMTNSLYLIATACASALSLALEFWLVSHVCRFYIEGKRNGFFELLLVTPITPADVFNGQWLALRRLFLRPVAAQVLLVLACGAIQVWASHSTAVAIASGGKAMSPPSSVAIQMEQVLAIGLGAISWCVGLLTIVWFSIWMGMTSNRIPIAMLKTFWYAKILPWFGVTFCSGIFFVMLLTKAFGSSAPFWLFPLTGQLLFLGVNIGLIVFARRRAQEVFPRWSNTGARG
jgi:ABC-type transport system involved in cytochrome c biogenesis permease component